MTPENDGRAGTAARSRPFRVFGERTQMALTSSGMPGPNVVDTAPFWM